MNHLMWKSLLTLITDSLHSISSFNSPTAKPRNSIKWIDLIDLINSPPQYVDIFQLFKAIGALIGCQVVFPRAFFQPQSPTTILGRKKKKKSTIIIIAISMRIISHSKVTAHTHRLRWLFAVIGRSAWHKSGQLVSLDLCKTVKPCHKMLHFSTCGQ